jgi:hypothetical protein
VKTRPGGELGKSSHFIVGIHIHDRMKQAPALQRLLSEYGCHIRTRLGLHDTGGNFCSPAGVILLELTGDRKTVDAFVGKAGAIEGVDVKKMIFTH